jgi:hypothetical protein
MVHAPRGSRGRGRGHVLVLDLDVADRENSLGVEEEEALRPVKEGRGHA